MQVALHEALKGAGAAMRDAQGPSRCEWRNIEMNTKTSLLAIALCAIAGCGGSVMSPSKLAASEGSVRGAEEVGARQSPRAGLHLKLAQDQLARAKVASENGDGEIADRLLQRSQADADLAIALANETSAEKTANKTIGQANEAAAKAQEGVQ